MFTRRKPLDESFEEPPGTATATVVGKTPSKEFVPPQLNLDPPTLEKAEFPGWYQNIYGTWVHSARDERAQDIRMDALNAAVLNSGNYPRASNLIIQEAKLFEEYINKG